MLLYSKLVNKILFSPLIGSNQAKSELVTDSKGFQSTVHICPTQGISEHDNF